MLLRVAFILSLSLILGNDSQLISQPNTDSQIKITDYSDAKNWSILSSDITHKIDVFFVHPTTYGAPSNGKYTASITNKELNEFTDSHAIGRMTSVFAANCNIFAPRYQQINMEVLSMSEKDQNHYLTIPINDIRTALVYYLQHLNNGRPFILASHSQGSDVLQKILIENPDIIDRNKLVAAYMPGWTFTDEILKQIKIPLSTSNNQTGGVVVWNTIEKNGSSPTLLQGAKCVNPLTWTTDTIEYPSSYNLGANILDKKDNVIEINNFTSAKINSYGGLEIPVPEPSIANKLDMSMGPGIYHKYDYDFFYNNIIENVADRCNEYLKTH